MPCHAGVVCGAPTLAEGMRITDTVDDKIFQMVQRLGACVWSLTTRCVLIYESPENFQNETKTQTPIFQMVQRLGACVWSLTTRCVLIYDSPENFQNKTKTQTPIFPIGYTPNAYIANQMRLNIHRVIIYFVIEKCWKLFRKSTPQSIHNGATIEL